VGDLIGYARVSTDEQNLALQFDALKQADCKRVFKDVGSGSLKQRPELDACLEFMVAGDTLVVWRLDRLGRGLKHLIEATTRLIPTSSSSGVRRCVSASAGKPLTSLLTWVTSSSTSAPSSGACAFTAASADEHRATAT
jgi:hypothetical protein